MFYASQFFPPVQFLSFLFYSVMRKVGVEMLLYGELYIIRTFFMMTGSPGNITRMSPMFKVIKEENISIGKAAEMAG